MIANLRLWLSAIAAAVAAVIGALLFRAGKKEAERAQLQARVDGAQARAQADADANVADPVAELHRRGWVRDVASDNGKS